MELALLVWGVSMLKGITFLLIAVSSVFLLAALIYLMASADYPGFKIRWRWPIGYLVAASAVTTLNIAIPSERTAYIMIGAYATQQIAQDPKSAQIGSKVLTIINNKLNSIIDEQTADSKHVK